MLDLVGQQLGHYRLIRLLGRGGYAAVYLGEHIRLDSPAAIKVLHARLAGSEEVNAFQNEGRIVAGLIHPHIVRVFDFDVEKDIPFMVMDYAPNGNLRLRFPKGERAELATILPYVTQVAGALQYAHDQHFVHCDIKPENMLLGRHDEVLLSDFGTAQVAQSTGYQSSLQEIIGTVAYMAPEQFQGKARPASDQYALAVVVYEWLCGELPFRGSGTEIAIQHAMKAPPPLHEKIPDISPLVEEVLMKALSKDHHQRFPRVQDFADALERASHIDGSIYSDPTVADIAAIPNAAYRADESLLNPQSVSNAAYRADEILLNPQSVPIVSLVSPAVSPIMKPSPLAMDTVTSEVPHTFAPNDSIPATGFAPLAQYAPISAPYAYQEKVIPRKRGALVIVLLLFALLALLLAGSILWFVVPRYSSGNAPLAPPAQVYANVAGVYHGTLVNTTAHITSRMGLSIQQNKATINGYFTVGAPLVGSNAFQGSIDTADHILFTVQSYRGNAPLFFDGTLQSDGSLSGNYCSLGADKQCSANAGASGTWKVSRG